MRRVKIGQVFVPIKQKGVFRVFKPIEGKNMCNKKNLCSLILLFAVTFDMIINHLIFTGPWNQRQPNNLVMLRKFKSSLFISLEIDS